MALGFGGHDGMRAVVDWLTGSAVTKVKSNRSSHPKPDGTTHADDDAGRPIRVLQADVAASQNSGRADCVPA